MDSYQPQSPQFGEPDTTAAGFARYIYEQFVPPPIPSNVPTRIQVDEFGKPVSPIRRHMTGIQVFLGSLILIVPLEFLLLFAVCFVPAFTGVVIALSTVVLVAFSAIEILGYWRSSTQNQELVFFTTSVFLVVTGILVLVSLIGGWQASSGWFDCCGGIVAVLAISTIMTIFRELYIKARVRDCLVWAATLPVAFAICLLPTTMTARNPFLPFFWAIPLNFAWATLVARSYLRFTLFNEYLEYDFHPAHLQPESPAPGKWPTLLPVLGETFAWMLTYYCLFQIPLSIAWNYASGIDQVEELCILLVFGVVLLSACLAINKRLLGCVSHPFRVFWVGWRAIVIFVGWRSPRVPGAFDFPGVWSAPAFRVALTLLVLMTNTMIIEFAAITPFYPRISPNMTAQPPRTTADGVEINPPKNGPLSVHAIPWWGWMPLSLALLVSPSLLAFFFLVVVHGPRLLAWHEYVELRLVRTPPPLESLLLDIRTKEEKKDMEAYL